MFINSEKKIKLLNIIKRNGFFELYPEFALDAARTFFDKQQKIPEIFFCYIQDPQQTLSSILKLLQIEEVQLNFLVTHTFNTKDFSKIIEFLGNYTLLTPNLLNLNDVEVLLTKLGLPQDKKKSILVTISHNLENQTLI